MIRSSEHLRRVRELFDAVIDQPESARSAALNRLAPDDAALRRDVEQMLTTVAPTDAVYASPLNARQHFAAADPAPLGGTRLGHYDMVRLVGIGGMGAV
ncbi:MAG: hypothetical protein ACRELE_07160, partial [Gemmatimonadales bacterium]